MRSTSVTCVFLVVAGILFAESHSTMNSYAGTASNDPVTSRGLKYFADGNSLIEGAIALANQIADPDGMKLVLVSAARGTEPLQPKQIPVFSVLTDRSATPTLAAVPRGCRCVFVDVSQVRLWVKAHSTGVGRFNLSTPE